MDGDGLPGERALRGDGRVPTCDHRSTPQRGTLRGSQRLDEAPPHPNPEERLSLREPRGLTIYCLIHRFERGLRPRNSVGGEVRKGGNSALVSRRTAAQLELRPPSENQADCSLGSEIRMGRSLLTMTSRVMMHSLSPGMEGSSYITSSMTSSSTARSPRAPVPRFMASRATAATASSVNLRRTFSRSKYF